MTDAPDWIAALRQGAFERVAGHVAAALAAGEMPPPPAVEAAMARALERGDPGAALKLWRRATAIERSFAPTSDLAARIVEADRDGAAGLADAALTLARAVAGQRPAKAHLLARLGDRDGAMAVFEAASAAQPRAVPLAIAALRQAIALGDMGSIRRHAEHLAAQPDTAPDWLWRFLGLLDHGRIEIGDIVLHLTPEVAPPALLAAFARGRFEEAERVELAEGLLPGDRLMDLGAGSGLVAISAARRLPGLPLHVVEGNPAMVALLRRNLAENGVEAEVTPTLVGDHDGTALFALDENYSASSVKRLGDDLPQTELPVTDIRRLQASFRPTVLSIDIEGAEAEVIPALDLTTLRRVVVEFHPDLIGPATMSDLIGRLLGAGFAFATAPERHVYSFVRARAGNDDNDTDVQRMLR
jgi:FkbM family methyltransferase